MRVLRALSEALAFALELAMLGAFGLWGFTLPLNASVRWSAGLGVPAATIALWSLCLAPRARGRLGRARTTALSLAPPHPLASAPQPPPAPPSPR